MISRLLNLSAAPAIIALIQIMFIPAALAQDSDRSPAPSAAPTLAAVEDLEPAVDVSDFAAVTRTQPAQQAQPAISAARDRLDLGTTSITGSQELPKVLYIVPWKKSDLGDLVGRPVNTLLDEVLAPVDPEVFERHLEYYDALYGSGDKE